MSVKKDFCSMVREKSATCVNKLIGRIENTVHSYSVETLTEDEEQGLPWLPYDI